MLQNSVKLLAVAVALVFSSSLAIAADKLSSGDQKFIKEAAAGGMLEVQLGKLAVEKASSQQVKDFGKRIERDHTKVNTELKQLASTKNVQIPTELEGKEKSTYERLSKLSGDRFDREYMQRMIDDHKEDVSAFQKQADKGDNADVKSFAAKTLPTLKEHLELAQSTGQQVGAASQGGLKGFIDKTKDKIKH
jgi:putative membrane protein